jgi:adenylate kinase
MFESQGPDNSHRRREYAQNKIQENIEAEIMQVVLEEARDSYDAQLVWVW